MKYEQFWEDPEAAPIVWVSRKYYPVLLVDL